MAKSIGSLYVDIIARTESLEKDMDKVKGKVSGMGEATKKAGAEAKAAFESFKLFNSFQGRGMTGITLDMMAFVMALQAVKQEVLYVIENINKIPGIPAEAVSNVNEFKIALRDARNEVDSLLAQGVSGFTQFAKSVGAGLGSIIFGDDAMDDSLKATLDSLDKLKEAEDPAYHDKVVAAVHKLSEARKADAVAAMDNAGKVAELMKQSKLYETFAKSSSIDTLTRLQAETTSYERQKQAHATLTEMKKQLHDAEVKMYNSLEHGSMATMSASQRVEALSNRISSLRYEISQLQFAYDKTSDPKTLQQLIDKTKLITIAQEQYNAAIKKMRTPMMEFRDVFVANIDAMDATLTSLVTGGELKMSNFLKNLTDMIIQTFFKMAIVGPLMNALFGSTTGFQAIPAFWSMTGKASGGPASGMTLVGEQGPELVNLGSGSTVIPAQQTAAMLGKGGAGAGTYYIDARGADERRVAALEQMLLGLNATVERRSVAAAISTSRRGGTLGRAMNGF